MKKIFTTIFGIGIVVCSIAILIAFSNQTEVSFAPEDSAALEAKVIFEMESNFKLATQQLVELSNTPNQTNIESAKKISKFTEQKAQARQQLLLELVQVNPSLVISYALPDMVRSKMPEPIQKYIETRKIITGTYAGSTLDNFEEQTSRDSYSIKDAVTGKIYEVHNLDRTKVVKHGDKVSIDGITIDDQIISSNVQVIQAAPIIQDSLPKQRKIAAVLFNYSNSPVTYSKEAVRSVVYDQGDAFIREVSFEESSFVGKNSENGELDVFGPFDLNIPLPTECAPNPLPQIVTLGDQVAASNGVDLTGYDHIMFYTSGSIPCYGGSAYHDGKHTHMTYLAIGVTLHELGHNLGFSHANTVTCTENGVRVAISRNRNCITQSYGDFTSVMGYSTMVTHYQNIFKSKQTAAIGWIKSENVLILPPDVTANGTYELEISETAQTGIQLIGIPRYSASGYIPEYYYLEYKQPIGFDAVLPESITNGVLIRLGFKSHDQTGLMYETDLIDATPNTQSFQDASLPVGGTFTDKDFGVTIKTLAANEQSATVEISYNPQPCVQENPQLDIASSTKIAPGGVVLLDYTLTNNASANCSMRTYTMNTTLTPEFPTPVATIYHTLHPDEFPKATGSIAIAAPTLPGTYTVRITVADRNNPSFTTTREVILTVEIPTFRGIPPIVNEQDVTGPVIEIIKPLDGTTISKDTKIKVRALDRQGISEVKIFVDNKIVKTCKNKTQCNYNLVYSSIKKGNHIIKVEASDSSDNKNLSTKSITIKK